MCAILMYMCAGDEGGQGGDHGPGGAEPQEEDPLPAGGEGRAEPQHAPVPLRAAVAQAQPGPAHRPAHVLLRKGVLLALLQRSRAHRFCKGFFEGCMSGTVHVLVLQRIDNGKAAALQSLQDPDPHKAGEKGLAPC